MRAEIEFQPSSEPPSAAQIPEQLPATEVQPDEFSALTNGNEDGAIFFNLDWQNQQAEDRRQRLTNSFFGENQSSNSDYHEQDHIENPAEINWNIQPENTTEAVWNNQTDSNNQTIWNNQTTWNNQTENSVETTWNNLFNRAKNHEDFDGFHNQPENFWQEIRRISEPRTIEIGIDDEYEPQNINETQNTNEARNSARVKVETNSETEMQTVSRYDELLAAMQTSELSAQEFAQTLPLNERTIFLVRYQLDEIFGASTLLQSLGKNEQILFFNEQTSLPDDNKRSADSINADYRSAKFPENLPANEFASATISEFAPAAIGEENTFGATDEEHVFGTINAALSVGNLVNSDGFKSENKTIDTAFNTVSPNATGGAGSIAAESYAARVVNNSNVGGNTNSESATVNSAARSESGTVIGGALVSGAFAAVDDYRQLENEEIGGSRAVGNFYDEPGNGFAAGATGAMISAAIGSVIPGAGTDVSGVLGFVSGVVVGVEADQGLRWLGADKMNFGGANNSSETLADNPTIPNLNLQLGYA